MSDRHWPLVVFGLLGLVMALCLRPLDPTPSPQTAPTPQPTGKCAYQYKSNGDPSALPDVRCTPGAIDPSVTQANIQTTICKPGYTVLVRPPEVYTNGLKRSQMDDYGVGSRSPVGYEEDHLIPLELGGAPRDPKNLWPEPGASPNPKDAVENRVHSLVCSGQMALAQAQGLIAADWTMLR
jgi:hypothetical protein